MKLFIAVSAILLAQVSAKCANGCSGHGTCGAGSQCNCHHNYMGSDCSLRTCYFAKAWVDTPTGDRNGDGDVTMEIQYDVNDGYSSERYSSQYGVARDIKFIPNNETGLTPQQQKWDEAHFYMECSNKGLCNRKTGQCECFPGYEGEGCQRTTCPGETENQKKCSGHGTCVSSFKDVSNYRLWDKMKTFKCQCDPGYKGSDCSLRTCAMEADPQAHQQVYTSSLQKIAWGSYVYRYEAGTSTAAKASQKETVNRIIDGDVHFTITVKDHFGDTWTSSAFTIKYNTRIGTVNSKKVIFNYPTSHDFEETKLKSNANVFEQATSVSLLYTNTKTSDDDLAIDVQKGLLALPHDACRDAKVWAVYVQRQGKTVADLDDLSLATGMGCYHDSAKASTRTFSKCDYPAGAWSGTKCTSHSFTSKSDCELMGYAMPTTSATLEPYASISSPIINGMDRNKDLSLPIFVRGTTTEDTKYSPYQCGRTTTKYTTASGTNIIRRDGLCLYIQTTNKVSENYQVTYTYNSKLKSDMTNWPNGLKYTAKARVGKSSAADVRDFIASNKTIIDTLVRVDDVSAHRRVSTKWENGIMPIGNGNFGKAKASTTDQIYPLRESLFKISECARRGLCNDETGECMCFKGHIGNACTQQKSVAFVA